MGKPKKKTIKAKVVAWPVSSYAQMVSPKLVIAVPKRETTWPIQIMTKARIPMGRFP
jgi:hypothetical protein